MPTHAKIEGQAEDPISLERSRLMARIKGRDTQPEWLVRRFLHARGMRFRLHDKRLPGKPDLVLARYHTVVRVQGCFWHAHRDCPRFRMPRTRVPFWTTKLAANRHRDTVNSFRLARLGWRVLTVWECQLFPGRRNETLDELYADIREPWTPPLKRRRRAGETFQTIRFTPRMGAEARHRRIGQAIGGEARPVTSVVLLRRGLPPLQYCLDSDLVILAERVRISFLDLAG